MKTCPNCESSIANNAKTCKHCGKIVTKTYEPKKCPYCESEVSETAKKCKHCGERLVFNEGKITNKETSPSKISSFFRFICFIILSVFVIGLLFILVDLVLSLLAQLPVIRIIICVVLLSGVLGFLSNLLLAGIGYLTTLIFKLPTNKKIARVSFIVILVSLAIIIFFILRTYKSSNIEISTTYKIFYTLIMGLITFEFSTGLKDLLERNGIE